MRQLGGGGGGRIYRLLTMGTRHCVGCDPPPAGRSARGAQRCGGSSLLRPPCRAWVERGRTEIHLACDIVIREVY